MNQTRLFLFFVCCLTSISINAQSKIDRLQGFLTDNSFEVESLQQDEKIFLNAYEAYLEGADEEVIDLLTEAIKIDNEHPVYHFYLGHSLYYLNKKESAFDHLEKSRAITFHENYSKQIAEIYIKEGFYEEAITVYKQMITEGNTDPKVAGYLAEACVEVGRPTEAIMYYKIAAANFPFYSEWQSTCYFNIANQYFLQQNYEAGATWFARYLDLRPYDLEAISALVQCRNKIDAGDSEGFLKRIRLMDKLQILPQDTRMFCVDKFTHGDYQWVAYKSVDLTVDTKKVDYIFFIADKTQKTIATFQTLEDSKPEAGQFVLSRTDAQGSMLVDDFTFPDHVDYESLKKELTTFVTKQKVRF